VPLPLTCFVRARAPRIRPTDLPMVGKLVRESRKRNPYGWHKYVLTLLFAQSRRWYSDEIILAKDKRNALRVARRNFPNARIK
jgi:hypothetical protein